MNLTNVRLAWRNLWRHPQRRSCLPPTIDAYTTR